MVEWVNLLQNKGKPPAKFRIPEDTLPVACWLSLDEADNDLQRFLTYLLESVKGVLPDDQAQASLSILGSLSASRAPDPQGFLITLLNHLSQQHRPVILILDDYHAIQDQAIHQAVQFMLRNLPQNLQMVIATRSDPPLGLAQLRARDQLCEIRMADLVFTQIEPFFFTW